VRAFLSNISDEKVANRTPSSRKTEELKAMSNPRTAISDLKLAGSPNLKRALGYKPQATLGDAERQDLAAMYSELKDRREKLLADIEENGLVLIEDRFNRGQLYQKRVANPAAAMLAQVEKQIVTIAKVLAATEVDEKELTAAELLAQTDELMRAN
jgi:hypothetical protein